MSSITREFPQTGAVSPHHSQSSRAEDRRGALVLTLVLYLSVLNLPNSHLGPAIPRDIWSTSSGAPTCQVTFSSHLGEMKCPFLNDCWSWLNVRNLELRASAAKVLGVNEPEYEKLRHPACLHLQPSKLPAGISTPLPGPPSFQMKSHFPSHPCGRHSFYLYES